MARPERHDADYFPFTVKDGKTLFILESKYQCKGTGFFTNVMRFLTQQPDHHFCIKDESDDLYFFSRMKCDRDSGMDMLNIMAKTGKIHSDLWVSYKVIASNDLLNSLLDAYRNRKNDIITIEKIIEKYVSCANNPQEGDISYADNPQEGDVSDTNKPQTKLKDTKLKKTKVKNPEIDIENSNNSFIEMFNKIEKDFSEKEIENCKQDFIDHWTEKNKNGKKELWEMQKTFEIKKRFQLWIRRDKQYFPKKWEIVKYGIG